MTTATNPIAYITANLVARPAGYRMRHGWNEGDQATHDLFRPADRFAQRFEWLVADVASQGFDCIDLWCAHLHPEWATVRHLEAARSVLDRYKMKVTAYLWYGGTCVRDIRECHRVMECLGTDLISGSNGMLDTDRDGMADALRHLKLRMAYENHFEPSADAILSKIGTGHEDVLGLAFDTGWAGTMGFDALDALLKLRHRIFHIHAKDVRARRAEKTGFGLIDMGHETCALGDGIVGVEAVIRQAVRAGFSGPIGIEHEPEGHCPDEEIRISLDRMRQWLGRSE